MTIADIARLLDAEILCGNEFLDREDHAACGSDMMSDVLAFLKDQAVLLTGLCNPQTVRTAMMMDVICIVLVRDKMPSEEIIEMARDAEIVLMKTRHRMFSSCGILYQEGLRGGQDYERLN